MKSSKVIDKNCRSSYKSYSKVSISLSAHNKLFYLYTVVAHKSLLRVGCFAGIRFSKIQKKGFSPFKPVFLKSWVAKASGGYWVRRMRQLPRAPPFLGVPPQK